MASRREDRKFRRHIRARMEKTGESYTTARLNLSKARTPSDATQQAEKSLVEKRERPSTPRLAIHRLLAEGRLKLTPPTPEEQARRRARLWASLEHEVKRIASSRQASGLLEAFRKRSLDDEQLQNAVRNLGTLPTGFMRQLEMAAEQIRQLQPLIEQAAAISDLIRQAQEMWAFAESSISVTEATRQALADFSAAHLASAEAEASRGIAQEMLAAVNSTPSHLISAALEEIENGPVAAALRLVNEGPVAEARRYFEQEDAVGAALRHLDNDAVAAAMRFQRSRLTETRKRHNSRSS